MTFKKPLATHCKQGHEMTPENTLFYEKWGYRKCKACYSVRQKELQERNKIRRRMKRARQSYVDFSLVD